jgi:Tol biopolymer transport system component
VNADGSGRRCTRNHSLTRLVWSPDARQIAFRQARPRRLGIVDAEAQHLRYLGYRGRFAGPAGWSPNSRKLAYYDSSGERVVVLSLGRLARPSLIVNEQDAPVTDFRWRRKGITYVAVRREQP